MGFDRRGRGSNVGAERAVGGARTPGKQTLTGALAAEGAPIQRKAQVDGKGPAPPPPAGGGSELSPDVRVQMEPVFGADLSAVRIHEGPQAQVLGAQAYTQGTDIHFAPGQYDPHSQHGRELLGHELSHVVQQAAGRVRGTTHAHGIDLNDDPALEHEADVLGAKAAASGQPATSDAPPAIRRMSFGVGQAKAVTPATADPAAESLSLPNDSQPVQAAGLVPVQLHPGDPPKKVYVPCQIQITTLMTGEEFKVATMRQVFGGSIDDLVWNHVKDTYDPKNSPFTVQVEASLLKRHRGDMNRAHGFDMDPDGGIAGAADRAKTFQTAPSSGEKTALLAEIDRRYYEASGSPKNKLIKPGEEGKAELWRTVRDEVLFQHQYIAHLPPKVKELIKLNIKGRELTPGDYDQLFRIAKKIEKMPPGQVSDYASKVITTTTDLGMFEAALEQYSSEMAERGQQAAERETVQTKLLGLDEVYKKYREYRKMQNVEAIGAAVSVGGIAGAGLGLGPTASGMMRDDLEKQLHRHGFASITEFETFIKRFEKSFEQEAANIAKDTLAKYAGRLSKESERYQDPSEVSALHQKLGGFRAQHAEFEKNATLSNNYARDSQLARLPGNGHLKPKIGPDEAKGGYQRAAKAKAAAQSELQGLAGAHPVFQEDGLPPDKRIDKVALAYAGEREIGGLLQAHIARRIEDINEAKSQIEGKTELVYKMDKLMPQFYAQQGIAPGSIYDMIIRDKMRDDTIIKIVGGIALALVAIALTIVSFGAATPAVVAAGASAGAFGLSAYMVHDEYQQYVEKNDLADVGMADPSSAIWLVLACAGAAVDMAAAVKAVRALGPAAKALDNGGGIADFTKVIEALQKAHEIDAKIAQVAEKAAAARKGFTEASGELSQALTGKVYSFPGPFTDPEVFRALVKMARAKLKEGVHSGQSFIEELKKARTFAKLGDMTPEELAKAKEAWAQALKTSDVEALLRTATQPFKGGSLTNAGRALTKHPEVLGLTKDTLRQTFRTDAALNAAAEGAVNRILQNGDSVVKELPRYGSVIEARGADGFGVRWLQETGEFVGFINP